MHKSVEGDEVDEDLLGACHKRGTDLKPNASANRQLVQTHKVAVCHIPAVFGQRSSAAV